VKNSKETFGPLFESGLYNLREDCILVEMIPVEAAESSSGLVLAASGKDIEGYRADKAVFVEVVHVGEGVRDNDTGEPIPLDFVVGNVLWVGPLATVRWVSDFLGAPCGVEGGRTLGIMQGFAENSYMTFKSREEYQEAVKLVRENK